MNRCDYLVVTGVVIPLFPYEQIHSTYKFPMRTHFPENKGKFVSCMMLKNQKFAVSVEIHSNRHALTQLIFINTG